MCIKNSYINTGVGSQLYWDARGAGEDYTQYTEVLQSPYFQPRLLTATALKPPGYRTFLNH